MRDGVIVERGPYADLRRRHAGEEVVDLTGGLVLPGFVDTHVHFPQVRVIGGLGMPLLDWLDRCALPEEARMADLPYAVGVAADFVARAGLGRHHDRAGLRRPLRSGASTRSSPRPRGSACGSPAASWSATASCGPSCTPRRIVRTPSRWRSQRAGTASAATATP